MRELREENLRDISVGAAFLGTGGGGNPHIGLLTAIEVLRQGFHIRLADPVELDPGTPAAAMFGIGAPTVSVEKIRNGSESVTALEALQRHTGQEFGAIAPIEVGGINSMVPLTLSAITGLPVLDLDGMGRAFPEVQMVTYSIYGISSSPMAIADERGNVSVIESLNDRWMERLVRSLVVVKGGHADAVGFHSTVGEFLRSGIPYTFTLAEQIGRIIRGSSDVWGELRETVGSDVVFEGKISDLERKTHAGFSRGVATVEGMGVYRGTTLKVAFQNENLVASMDGDPIATVPDLITFMDFDSAKPLTTEVIRYGMRVRVVVTPCHDKWRTPEALAVVGPEAFGYPFAYRPGVESG
ncbi:MAG: DUF917 domain-containing protein [Alicyclobacillus sp.]|nr:DUF917 domain-containing protein [Alicyclobacillus sp.]